jgi:hypothetical protein
MVGHFRTYIISGVGHPRSDLVVPLMLWTVAYNGQGIGIYYSSFGIVPTLLRMGNISGRPYY